MGMFEFYKIPDIILSPVSSQKLDWTHILTPTVYVGLVRGSTSLRFLAK